MKTVLAVVISYLFMAIPGCFAQKQEWLHLEKAGNRAKFNSMLFSVDYENNTSLLGISSNEIKQPFLATSSTFFSRWGADLSVVGYLVDNSDESYEDLTGELDLIIGYTWEPTKYLSIYPSYSHFFYSSNSGLLKSLFSDDLRLDADFNYKFFNLGLSAGYFMGSQSTFYAALYNYYTIDLQRFIFRGLSLSIQPGIDANLGSYEYLNLYYLDKLKQNESFYTYLLTYPAIRRYVLFQMRQNPGLTKEEVLDEYLREVAQDDFKFTSLCINLPFYFILGDFGINIGLSAMVPLGMPDYLSDEVQFFFNIGISYSLMLK
jgi:hypothetical protein